MNIELLLQCPPNGQTSKVAQKQLNFEFILCGFPPSELKKNKKKTLSALCEKKEGGGWWWYSLLDSA